MEPPREGTALNWLAAATGWNRHMDDRIMQEAMKQVHDEIGSLSSRLQ